MVVAALDAMCRDLADRMRKAGHEPTGAEPKSCNPYHPVSPMFFYGVVPCARCGGVMTTTPVCPKRSAVLGLLGVRPMKTCDEVQAEKAFRILAA